MGGIGCHHYSRLLIHFPLLHFCTYYSTLIYTGRFELDFIAEEDVGTFDVNRLVLAGGHQL